VFGPVQAAEGVGPTGIRMRGSFSVEGRFQGRRHSAVRLLVRSRQSHGRHRPRPQLTDRLFPNVDLRGDIHRTVERDAGGLELLIVTADTVTVERGSDDGRLRLRRGDVNARARDVNEKTATASDQRGPSGNYPNSILKGTSLRMSLLPPPRELL